MEEIKTYLIDAFSRQAVEKFGNPRPLLSDQLTLDIPPAEIQAGLSKMKRPLQRFVVFDPLVPVEHSPSLKHHLS